MTLIIIILIIGLVIYFYYQNQRLKTTGNSSASSGDDQTSSTTQVIFNNDWESQTASVITSLEQEVQDLTSERDEAIRSKNEAEQDYLTQVANQDRELKDKVKEFQASNGELLKRIEELSKGELPEDYEDLITERDAAIRDKKTAEQDLLATTNRLKNKSQEAEAKANQIELLKKEKSQVEIRLNKTITELRTKYTKQSQLLDTEQLECKKLEEENEKLTKENQELTQQNIKMGQRLLELDPPTEVNL